MTHSWLRRRRHRRWHRHETGRRLCTRAPAVAAMAERGAATAGRVARGGWTVAAARSLRAVPAGEEVAAMEAAAAGEAEVAAAAAVEAFGGWRPGYRSDQSDP